MTQPPSSRWLLLLPAVVLSACSGDTTSTELDYDPAATVAQLEAVVGPLVQGENAFYGLYAAGQALGQFSDTEPPQDLLGFRPALEPRARAVEARRTEEALWSAQVAFPPEIVGQTLVWDAPRNRYVVDETRTDAPQDGVRIVHYTMSQSSATPLLPLQEIGYIDLMDEDVTGEERLAILVVITTGAQDVTLLDYVVAVTGPSETSMGDLLFTAVGTLASASGTVAFELAQGFTWSEAEDSETLTLDYRYEVPGGGAIALGMEGTKGFEAERWDGGLNLLVEITDAEDLVEVDASIAGDGSLNGTIRLNGTGVVAIAGSDGSVTFSHAGGESLAQQDRAALRNLWSLMIGLLGLTEGLFWPAGILLLPG